MLLLDLGEIDREIFKISACLPFISLGVCVLVVSFLLNWEEIYFPISYRTFLYYIHLFWLFLNIPDNKGRQKERLLSLTPRSKGKLPPLVMLQSPRIKQTHLQQLHLPNHLLSNHLCSLLLRSNSILCRWTSVLLL